LNLPRLAAAGRSKMKDQGPGIAGAFFCWLKTTMLSFGGFGLVQTLLRLLLLFAVFPVTHAERE